MEAKHDYLIENKSERDWINAILMKYFIVPSDDQIFYLKLPELYESFGNWADWSCAIIDKDTEQIIGTICEFDIASDILFEFSWDELTSEEVADKVEKIIVTMIKRFKWKMTFLTPTSLTKQPWEVIPEHYGWEKFAVRLWWEKKTYKEISAQIKHVLDKEVKRERISNVFSELRRNYLLEVPKDKDRKK